MSTPILDAVSSIMSGLLEAGAPAPDPPVPKPEPGFRERGRMRRRARYLRRLREVQLRDIGGFVVELHRLERERPELVREKLTEATRTDAELRALERALGERQPLRELREPGIGGACDNCGAVHGSEDSFCATCGKPLRTHRDTAEGPSQPGNPGPR
jgi:hypothetical protein